MFRRTRDGSCVFLSRVPGACGSGGGTRMQTPRCAVRRDASSGRAADRACRPDAAVLTEPDPDPPAAVGVYGGLLVAHGVLTIGMLVASTLDINRFFDPIRELSRRNWSRPPRPARPTLRSHEKPF
jgi:hypothetical protein